MTSGIVGGMMRVGVSAPDRPKRRRRPGGFALSPGQVAMLLLLERAPSRRRSAAARATLDALVSKRLVRQPAHDYELTEAGKAAAALLRHLGGAPTVGPAGAAQPGTPRRGVTAP